MLRVVSPARNAARDGYIDADLVLATIGRMKFALLNADPAALILAEALIQAGHERTLSFAAGAEWETVLACGANFVLLGLAGSEDDRIEKLRRLIQEAVPAVFVHPQTTSALAYYELDMHRQATNVALVPYEPLRNHPALDETAKSITAENQVDQVICERRLRDRSRAAVLSQLACDLGAVRRLVGQCEKVSALGTLTDDPAAGHLGVQLTTHEGALIRWSIAPAAAGDRDVLQMTVIAADGQTSLELDPSESASHAAATIVTALGDPQQRAWREALADLELVEAIERSLRKGRTVELFHEEASEQGTFKGVMAAGGCFLIVLSIGLAIAATIIGRFRLWIANAWPFVLLTVLVIFLGLQLFRFAFPADKADSDD